MNSSWPGRESVSLYTQITDINLRNVFQTETLLSNGSFIVCMSLHNYARVHTRACLFVCGRVYVLLNMCGRAGVCAREDRREGRRGQEQGKGVGGGW